MNFEKQLRADPARFKLAKIDPAFTGKLTKKEAVTLQAQHLSDMQLLQDRLYAENRNAILLVLQGMDAAGKDGIIKHVMSGINPAGCQVVSFKTPTPREMRHGFLWRHMVFTPEKGIIGIFNRSHYEEVLIVRVHPEFLQKEQLPKAVEQDKKIWKKRFQAINDFERYLDENGIRVIKVFLHISKAEQGQRFLDRLADQEKNWKFCTADLEERAFWPKYQQAFEDTICQTSTSHAPWYVVPADHKWFARTAVGAILVRTLKDINPQYPLVTAEKKQELRKLHNALKAQLASG